MYKIYSFGYGVEDCKAKYKTYEEAKAKFDQLVDAFCDKAGVDLDDEEVSYDDNPGEFIYAICDQGVDIYRIIEVPEFKNEIDKKLWEIQFTLDKANDAIRDYKYALQDCCAEDYVSEAKDYVDAVRKLMKDGGIML